MLVALTPGQSVTLHGWAAPRPSLRWRDVVEKPAITFDACRNVGIPLGKLHELQPAFTEWVRHGGVGLHHVVEMHELWTVDVFRDLRADLADVLAMHWPADTMKRLGIAYTDLRAQGMGPDAMRMFGFSILGWINLGFTLTDLRGFTDAQIAAVFLLTRQAAERSFIEQSTAAP